MHASRMLHEVSKRVRVKVLLHIAYLGGFRRAWSQLTINLSISVGHDLLDVLREVEVRRSYMVGHIQASRELKGCVSSEG